MTSRDDFAAAIQKALDEGVTSDELVEFVIVSNTNAAIYTLEHVINQLAFFAMSGTDSFAEGWNNSLSNAVGYIMTMREVMQNSVEGNSPGGIEETP